MSFNLLSMALEDRGNVTVGRLFGCNLSGDSAGNYDTAFTEDLPTFVQNLLKERLKLAIFFP